MDSGNEQPEGHTEDTSPNSSDPESTNHPSGDCGQESDHDQGFGHGSDSDSDCSSHPGSNPGSKPGSDSESESSFSSTKDDQAGDFSDMFNHKGGSSATTPKKLESHKESGSHSQSREAEGHKRPHMPSLENLPNPDKQDWKKKKSEPGCKETPSKSYSKQAKKQESLEDKVAQQFGEEVVLQYQA